MTFVFSFWYIVLILLVIGVVLSIVFFIRMDKKDEVLINDFVKNSTEPAKESVKENKVENEEIKVEETTEENKE